MEKHMNIHKNDILFWAIWSLIISVILASVLFLPGCDSLAQKAAAEAKHAQKLAIENTAKIQGNANEIKTVNQSMTTFKTEIREEQNAYQKSQSAKFEKFEGSYESKQKNITNAVWPYVVIILALLFGFLWFYRGFGLFGRTR